MVEFYSGVDTARPASVFWPGLMRRRRLGMAVSVTLMTTPWLKPSTAFYKAEVIHRKSSWRKIDDVEMATLKWVDWFNNRRLLEPIGNIPPAEAEELYHAQINPLELVA